MKYVILFLIFGVLAFGIGKIVWSYFDHYGWKAGAHPSKNATITGFSSEEVIYAKNAAKFKTTVTFSDGFYFITHKTNREQHFLKYRISIDASLKAKILSKAMEKHKAAVENVVAKGGRI